MIRSRLHALPACFAMMLAVCPLPAYTAESWPFNPVEDSFSADSQLDLRQLNESYAGAAGFITLSKDGNDFAHADGSPERFWCINGGAKDEDLAHEARFLAKHGVNLIRLPAQLSPGPNSKITDVNQETIEHLWKTIAAMKKEGIYCTISPYWASCGLQPSWGIHGHSDAWGVLFCDSVLQTGYKAWMKALYSQRNPYTGTPLALDPAIAFIQLQNEDSLLFWTMIGFINQKGQPFDELRKGFGDFAKDKYGSLAKAQAAWGGDSIDDDIAAGMVGFHQIWEITSNPGGGKGERISDQIEFWTKTMHGFNAAIARYLHEELGCKQLINAGNWRVADVVKQMDAERWSYTASDVIAINRYFGGLHVGPDCGWSIEAGHAYTNDTCLLNPTAFPINAKQVVKHPYIVTESNWVNPNLYQSEGPLMIAAYSSLTGVDGFFWFTSSSREWDAIRWPWGRHPKWGVGNPMGIGQFPAAAWMYRKGYVKHADQAAVHEERELADMWHEKSPLITEEGGYDPNRDAGLPAKSAVKTTINPLAFLVGPVEVVYGGDPAKCRSVNLASYIDEGKKTIISLTGEEKLDYSVGICTVNAPKAQGAAGFLRQAGTITLGDVTISCTNDYATIVVIALDDKPIKDSSRVLVQIGTVQRATHWADHPGPVPTDDKGSSVPGSIIDNAGEDPWQIESASGTLTIRNPKLAVATMLDPNGMAAGMAKGSRTDGAFSLELPRNALYAIISDTSGTKAALRPHS